MIPPQTVFLNNNFAAFQHACNACSVIGSEMGIPQDFNSPSHHLQGKGREWTV